MRATRRKIARSRKALVSNSDLRKIIRENIVIKETFETLEDLRSAQTEVESSIDAGVKEAEAEVKSGAFSNMLEQFFNSLGFVDPCDLVRKDPKEVKSQADELENALAELRVAKAENINAKLGSFANAVGIAGAGSLTYFAFTNTKNIARAGAGGLLDLARNTDNDEKNRSIMQKAQQALPADQQSPDIKAGGGEYSRDAAVARIKSMDDAIEADLVPKDPPPIEQMRRSVGLVATPTAAEAASNLVDRWSSGGYDKSRLFPQGKDYTPFQVFLKKKGLFGDRYVFDEKEISPEERKKLRAKGIDHSRIKSYRRDQNVSAAFMKTSAAEDVKQHPDYVDLTDIFSAGQAGTDALTMAMLEKSKQFKELGYRDPRAFWDDMTNKFTEAAAVAQDEDRSWLQSLTAELKGERPTEWQIYFDPKGTPGDRAAKNVATANVDDFLAPNRVPRNANPCQPDEVPGQGGKCVPAINWNNKGWFVAGKYLVIGAAVLHVYKTLLALAPGPVCSIKNFLKEVFSGIFGFIGSMVGGIVDAIKSAVKFVVDGVSGIFESKDFELSTVVELQESANLWSELDTSISMLGRALKNENNSGLSGLSIMNTEAIKEKLERRLRENRIRNSVRSNFILERLKKEWLYSHLIKEKKRKLKISNYLIVENTAPEEIAGEQAIQAAQKQVDPLQDAFTIFKALKGAGTNERDVEGVIRKRLDDLDALYLEYEALLDIMKKSKATFDQNLSNSNSAAVMGGIAYGIYALTPDDKKAAIANKVKDLTKQAGDKITQALGKEKPEEVIAQLPPEAQAEMEKSKEEVEKLYQSVIPSGILDTAQQAAEKAPEIQAGLKINLDSGPSVSVDEYKIKPGDKGTLSVNDDQEFEFEVFESTGAVSGVFLKVNGPDGAITVKSIEELKDMVSQFKLSESNLRENEIQGAATNLLRAYGGKDAAKHIALAGATAIGAKYATAAAKTWWDSVGLDDDLIQWLEDDGMTDEADLVRKAVEKKGINVPTASNYDRGY